MNILRSTWFQVVLVALAIVMFGLGLLWGWMVYEDQRIEGHIAQGVVVGSVPVGGMTFSEARALLLQKIADFESVGLIFEVEGKTLLLGPEALSQAGPDYSYTFFEYDVDASVERAYAFTRKGSLFQRTIDRMRVARDSFVIPFDVRVDDDGVKEFVQTHFADIEIPLQEVGYSIAFTDGVPEISVEPGSPGRVLVYDDVAERVHERLQFLQVDPIVLGVDVVYPRVSQDDAHALRAKLDVALVPDQLTFVYDDKHFDVGREVYATWIQLGWVEGAADLVLDDTLVDVYIDEIASDIEEVAHDAKFEVGDDGNVRVFQAAEPGLLIDRVTTKQAIADVLFDGGGTEIVLSVIVSEPEIATADVNSFGIQELISEGRTNFSGSPINRRHNIARGIALINGRLLKPGEEFSAIASLGDISLANGFKSELVIKGNETKPETGGGLCQVSTTLFRATLNAGLPVTARKNHSYRVSYYEPPVGKDATIYDPAPDYRFVNDTEHYILIKGWVEGNEAVFQLWGKKDGRVQTQSEPVVYDFVAPPGPLHTFTTELPPGVKKCTEHAHAGASAHFDYAVTYPNGEVKEERFSSKYRPWREVCLIGATEEQIAEDEAIKQLKAEQDQIIGVVE